MKGRPRTPAALRSLQGNPGHRPDDGRRELSLPPGAPEPPEYLSAGARKEWFRLLGYFAPAGGLVSPADAAALGIYCSYFDQWQQAEAALPGLRGRLVELEDQLLAPEMATRARGVKARREMIERALGRARNDLNVAIGERNRARKEMRPYLVELGMTIASRARIRVPSDQLSLPGVVPDDDPMAKITRMITSA